MDDLDLTYLRTPSGPAYLETLVPFLEAGDLAGAWRWVCQLYRGTKSSAGESAEVVLDAITQELERLDVAGCAAALLGPVRRLDGICFVAAKGNRFRLQARGEDFEVTICQKAPNQREASQAGRMTINGEFPLRWRDQHVAGTELAALTRSFVHAMQVRIFLEAFTAWPPFAALERERAVSFSFQFATGTSDVEVPLGAYHPTTGLTWKVMWPERPDFLALDTSIPDDTWQQILIQDLFQAAQRGDLDAVKQVIAQGASADHTMRGHSAGRVALEAGAGAVARTLFRLENPDQRARSLAFAVTCDDADSVRLLVELGCDPNAADEDGLSLLMQLARSSVPNAAVCTALLAAGASANARDQEGRTALWHAVQNNDEEIARLLLEWGASTDVVTGGQSLRDLAQTRSWTWLVDACVQR